jgi:hypothetical protein
MTTAAPPPFTCMGCDASLDGIPEGDPCPVCGGTQRRKNLSAGAILEAVALVDGLSVSVGHARVPTWATLWAQIERRMARLRELYDPASDPVSNAVMEDEIDALLTCLNHLGDWLQNDDTLPAFDKETVKKGMTDSTSLALCRDYANTFKHHTRSNPGARVARLEATTTDARGQSARIRYWSTSEPEQSIDALDLAAQCHNAWRGWLTREGVLT